MNPDRVPPQNLEAEQSLLGSLLYDPEQGPVVFPFVRKDAFYREAHQRIYGVMQRQYDAGLPFDLVATSLGLREQGMFDAVGGLVYLTTLLDSVPTAANAWYYRDLVRGLARRRERIDLGQRMIEAAHTSDEATAAAEEAILSALTAPADEAAAAVDPKARLAELVTDHIGRSAEVEHVGIGTGFPALDRMTNGLRPGQVWLIAGRTSMGKTAFCLSLVQHVMRRHPVLYLSMEQTIDELWNRLLGMISGIPTRRLTNMPLTGDEKRTLDRAYVFLRDCPITLEFVPALTAPLFHQRVRQAAKDGEAAVVALDHIGLLDKGGRQSRYDRITQISNQVRETAGEFDVPTLSLVQLNRGGERSADKRPSLELLRDTGAHEENAHVILGIYRQAYYDNEAADPNEPQDSEVLVLKAREGQTGMFPCVYVPGRTFFAEPLGGRYVP